MFAGLSSIDIVFISLLYCAVTVGVYVGLTHLQYKLGSLWCNPMMWSVVLLSALFIMTGVEYANYQAATQSLTWLIEPAVVAFGLPLYQQISEIKFHWKKILLLLLIANTVVIVVSLILVMLFLGLTDIAISVSLKSITTAIAITLTQQLNGAISITAFAVILAGLLGAFIGIPWLNFIKVTSPRAQGLAIGAASHALGTATISQISQQHGAFASIALIVSATITAIIAPVLITYCLSFF